MRDALRDVLRDLRRDARGSARGQVLVGTAGRVPADVLAALDEAVDVAVDVAVDQAGDQAGDGAGDEVWRVDLDDHDLAAPVPDGRSDAAREPRPTGAPDPAGIDAVVLVAPSLADLRRLPALVTGLPPARRVTVLVRLPRRQALRPPVLQVPPPRTMRLERRGSGNRPWVFTVEHGKPVAPGGVLAALLAGSRLGRVAPWGFLVGAGGPGVTDWLVGEARPRYVSQTAGPDVLAEASVDVVVRAEEPVGEEPSPPAAPRAAVLRVPSPQRTWAQLAARDPSTVGAEPPGWSPRSLAPVDERAVNPTGFLVETDRPALDLRWDAGSWRATGGGRELTLGDGRGRVSDVDVEALRPHRSCRLDPESSPGPFVAARLVTCLAAAGVPLQVSPRPAWLRLLLGTDLETRLDPSEDDLADPLRREEHSVRLRRAALATHGASARWQSVREDLGLPARTRPQVSVLLATRRPGSLRAALAQVAAQRGVDVQLVLGAHGFDPTAGPAAEALAACPLDVTAVAVPASRPLGAVLATMADRADAPLLAKMDDDDSYGPDHLGDLVLAQRYSGADVVGCAAEFVYLEPLDLTVRRSWAGEAYGRNLAGGALLVRRSVYDDAGGFRPIPRSVDRELLRAVDAAGGLSYRSHGLNYVLHRGGSGHTWASPMGYFLVDGAPQWRGFRPSALVEQGASAA